MKTLARPFHALHATHLHAKYDYIAGNLWSEFSPQVSPKIKKEEYEIDLQAANWHLTRTFFYVLLRSLIGS